MPKVLTWLDGQQSASAPAIGSLERQVTGTRAAPTAITVTGITPGGYNIEMIFVAGSGGAIDVTANPQIVAGTTTGQELNLVGTSDTNTVTLEHGNGLILNGTCELDSETVLNLLWDGTAWLEMSRSK